MNTKIILAGLGVATIARFGIYKGFSLSGTASNIRVSLAALPKIHKIDLTGFLISTNKCNF